MTLRLFFVVSDARRSEHITNFFVTAETPEQAFELWEGFYGYPWDCRIIEVPPISTEPRVMRETWTTLWWSPDNPKNPHKEQD